MVGVRTARVGEKEIRSQLKPYAFILHTLQESYSLYKTLFFKTGSDISVVKTPKRV